MILDKKTLEHMLDESLAKMKEDDSWSYIFGDMKFNNSKKEQKREETCSNEWCKRKKDIGYKCWWCGCK